jgi:hypothetical protein
MADGILKVGTITTSSGSGNITLGQSGETISVPTGVSVSGSISNKPAFFARLSANQDVSDNVATKVQCDEEILDSDNCYDNSTNYRFTPNVAGKYYVYGYVSQDGGNSTLISTQTIIYKNGSLYQRSYEIPANNYGATSSPFVGCVVDMNGTTDYIELYATTDLSSGSPDFFGVGLSSFGAYKLIGA